MDHRREPWDVLRRGRGSLEQARVGASSWSTRARASSALVLAAVAVFTAVACGSGAPAVPAAAPAAHSGLADVRVLARFDKSMGEKPESVAAEPGGGAVVGLLDARQVVRVRADGGTEVLLTMPVPPGGGGTTPVVKAPELTGVARDPGGAVLFLYAAGRGGLTGVWRLAPGSTEPELIVPMPADSLPNALVLDQLAGRLLVTDSAGGRVWTAPLSGGRPTVWSADPALAPARSFGANGLKVHAGAVWVSNSDAGTIVRIPVGASGAAGPATVRARGLDGGVDDFDFTGSGDEILAALNPADQVVSIAADGGRRRRAVPCSSPPAPTAPATNPHCGSRGSSPAPDAVHCQGRCARRADLESWVDVDRDRPASVT